MTWRLGIAATCLFRLPAVSAAAQAPPAIIVRSTEGQVSVRAQRGDDGWSFEAAIPFKSLRYAPGREQPWGFNVSRTVRWKNENAFLTRVPAAIGGNSGIMYSSFAATMSGLEAPAGSGRLLELKPYVTGDMTTDLTATPRVRNDPGTDAGLDVKYGITGNLTIDFTVNTDFAQVEADEQQVNLTRFNLFFPEEREFFLENQGQFAFGSTGAGGGGDVPLIFYSRSIGLDAGREVPISAGGRLSGRVGRYNIGGLHIGAGFMPDGGFVRRPDQRKNYALARFSPRLLGNPTFRKLSIVGTFSHVKNGRGRLDTRDTDLGFTADLQSSNRFSVGAHDYYEFVPAPFRAAGVVTVPVGIYAARTARGGYAFGPQRNVFGTVSVEGGSFYVGTRLTTTLSGARVRLLTQLSVEPSLSINRLRLPGGEATVRLVGSRATYTLTPMSFASALVQYNSSTNSLSVNARLRWEYIPGSELFVVFNERRDTRGAGYPDLANRAFIVKVNRLLRF